MKNSFIIILGFLLLGCSSTQLVDNWKNPDIDSYVPSKVLVIGLTSNLEARQKFENQLKYEIELRGAEAVMSLDMFDPSFRTEKMTPDEIKELENKLISEGFDTVLFSKVAGVENKIAYKQNYRGYDETYKRFKEEYLMYQDIFYNPDYYEEYNVYHAETSMYCICPTKDRELLWKGYIDVVDPKSINETVNDYVRLVIVALEEQDLISKEVSKKEKNTNDELIQ